MTQSNVKDIISRFKMSTKRQKIKVFENAANQISHWRKKTENDKCRLTKALKFGSEWIDGGQKGEQE